MDRRELLMSAVALCCHLAENGQGEKAIKSLIGKIEEADLAALAQFADTKEDDIISFYRLNLDVVIDGKWGSFVLCPGLPPDESESVLPCLTPIGLYALAHAFKEHLSSIDNKDGTW